MDMRQRHEFAPDGTLKQQSCALPGCRPSRDIYPRNSTCTESCAPHSCFNFRVFREVQLEFKEGNQNDADRAGAMTLANAYPQLVLLPGWRNWQTQRT